MKLKNLAFFGVMASILGVGAASADTIIASKAYVDAQTTPKENKADKIQTTYSDYTEADTDQQKVDYPSMYTLKGAMDSVQTSVGSGAWDANALDSTAQTATNKAKLMKVEALQDTTERAEVLQSGQTIADVALWTSTGDNAKSDDYLVTAKAVAQQLDKLESNAATSNVLDYDSNADLERVTKVKAIQDSVDTAASATWTPGAEGAPGTLTIVSGENDGNRANKLATSAQVRTSVDALKSYVDDHTSGAIDGLDLTAVTSSGQAIVSVRQDDGQLDAQTGTISYQNGLNNTLASINAATTAASCSASDPCMLTYIGEVNGTPRFRWTNLATENLTADTTAGNMGTTGGTPSAWINTHTEPVES